MKKAPLSLLVGTMLAGAYIGIALILALTCSAGIPAETGLLPLVTGSTALRLSAYALDYGGFVDNKLVTRDWVNGTVSNDAGWAGNDYNTQHTHGARVALKQQFSEGWDAIATYMVQNQIGHGAWDEQPQLYGDDAVARFGPEARYYYDSM